MSQFMLSVSNNYLSDIDWAQVATVVIAGVVIVLGVLLVLIGVFNGFGKLVSGLENSAKNRKARKEAKKIDKSNAASPADVAGSEPKEKPADAIIKPPAVVEQGISGEVVAVITAAITASEGSSNFVIRSVKRKEAGSRNPWARAAVADNTRAF